MNIRHATLAILLLLSSMVAPAAPRDPLPSWRDGPTKEAITGFVARVTDRGGGDFVPPEERIAVFDNDGTLWAEQPMYFQVLFAFDRLRELAPAHPDWQASPVLKAVIDGDMKAALAGGEKGLVEVVLATHAGPPDEFAATARTWLREARHPRFKRRFDQLTYQPMRELLAWLRTNGFKTYIVSGGDTEFIRAYAEAAYGIPPEQVIGSRLEWSLGEADGKLAPSRVAKLDALNDGAGKVLSIINLIGRRPILAMGNSDGDVPMLRWTSEGAGPRLAALVHHTDADREAAYDRESKVGRLDKGLVEAGARRWLRIDMARDWTQVFSAER